METFFEAIKLSKNFNGVKTHPIVWDVRKSAELCRALLLAAVSMLFFLLPQLFADGKKGNKLCMRNDYLFTFRFRRNVEPKYA